MCDPFTLMAVGGSVASAGGSLLSGFMGGDAADRQGDFLQRNADLLAGQAQLVTASAELPLLKARLTESRIRDAGNMVLAKQEATVASNFMDATYGSPVVIAARTVGQIESDIGIARAGAQLERADILSRAAGVYQQAYGQTVSATSSYNKAFASRAAGVIGAGSALLQAGGKMRGFGGGDAGGGFDLSNPFYARQPEDI